MILSNSKVSLYFSLTLDNGNIVDSNFQQTPATFIMGDGSLLPGFEKQLLGLKPGDKKVTIIPQQEGFGARNPHNIQQFKRSIFPADQEISEGLMMSFADAAGGELPGVIISFDDQTISVDFNHPLAGRDITFTVEIIHVE